jgi:hypothetical protein
MPSYGYFSRTKARLVLDDAVFLLVLRRRPNCRDAVQVSQDAVHDIAEASVFSTRITRICSDLSLLAYARYLGEG